MSSCTLCDLPTPDPPVTDAEVAGTFCCRGCLEVARTLDDAAGSDPDAVREALSTPTPDEAATGAETFLSVEGMHCATCEAFVESRAAGREGVLAAEASYPSNMVKLVYDPERVDADALPGLLSGLGYTARPLDDRGEAGGDESVGRLLVGGFFGMMTMLWYVLFLYPAYLGVDPASLLLDVTGSAGQYLVANIWLMATVVLLYTGYPLLRGAYVSLRAGHPNMDLLVALASVTAYVYSVGSTLLGGTEVYFDITVVIVLVVSLGDYYEDRLKRRAAGRLSDLTASQVDEARVRTPDGPERVGIDAVDPGDELVVREGERIPLDGAVVEGSGAVDESLVTGESVPVRRGEGDEVVGGAVLVDGALVVEVADDATSTLDRIVSLLWDIQSTRPGAQRLADRIAAVFVPSVLVLAVAAAGYHLLAGATLTGAFLTGLAVLVVSCPCALGLATPLAVASGISSALERGVVVTDGAVFERASETDVVAFDKTGTLTAGRMELLSWTGDEAALARAAAVEQFSDHPIARCVTEAATPADAPVSAFERRPGGVAADVGDERVLVGRPSLFESAGWPVPAAMRTRYESGVVDGLLPALVGTGGTVDGVLVAGDRPRENWEQVVSSLAAAGMDVVVLTGDSPEASATYERHPAVSDVFAGVPPEAKAEVVDRLRERGTTAMVGDGSNDAPALASADLGIALASGTDLAADAADAVVTTDDLAAVPAVFSLTRSTRRRIRENLGWAFLYNAVAIPLAVTGLLNPLLAALAMATSSLLVVANSARSLDASLDADAGDASTDGRDGVGPAAGDARGTESRTDAPRPDPHR